MVAETVTLSSWITGSGADAHQSSASQVASWERVRRRLAGAEEGNR